MSQTSKTITIAGRSIGEGQPVFVIAEIGINHNGDIHIAKKLIDAAALAGCDAVKFQKRTPELCVPPEQRTIMRETPWGLMNYLDYRYKVEFDKEQYAEIDRYCKEKGILWFASCWDEPSVDFMEQFNPPCYKIASACLTDDALLRKNRNTGRPILISTGMSDLNQIDHAVEILGKDNLLIMHCTSTYPCKPSEVNLQVMGMLRDRYQVPVGYSGHEVGLLPTVASVLMGACSIERHLTLDRAMWGSDQAASIEPPGFHRLVRDVRQIPELLGDGVKRVYDSELPILKRLRRVPAGR